MYPSTTTTHITRYILTSLYTFSLLPFRHFASKLKYIIAFSILIKMSKVPNLKTMLDYFTRENFMKKMMCIIIVPFYQTQMTSDNNYLFACCFLQGANRDYVSKLEEVGDLQSKCLKEIQHQRYRMSIISNALKL